MHALHLNQDALLAKALPRSEVLLVLIFVGGLHLAVRDKVQLLHRIAHPRDHIAFHVRLLHHRPRQGINHLLVAALEEVAPFNHSGLHADRHLRAKGGLERLQHLRVVHVPPRRLDRERLEAALLQPGGHVVNAAKLGPLVHFGVVVRPNAIRVLDYGADVTDEECVEAEPDGDGEHGGPDLRRCGRVEIARLGALRQQARETGVRAERVLHKDWLICQSAGLHPSAAHHFSDVEHHAGIPVRKDDGEEEQKQRAQHGAREGQHVAPAHEVAEEAREAQELDHGHHGHQDAGFPNVDEHLHQGRVGAGRHRRQHVQRKPGRQVAQPHPPAVHDDDASIRDARLKVHKHIQHKDCVQQRLQPDSVDLEAHAQRHHDHGGHHPEQHQRIPAATQRRNGAEQHAVLGPHIRLLHGQPAVAHRHKVGPLGSHREVHRVLARSLRHGGSDGGSRGPMVLAVLPAAGRAGGVRQGAGHSAGWLAGCSHS
mmetsp:Transcript_6499/g.16633  ORF Transcript_6499/g.16633 Transcript_6499/m.16633 type:complete len:483 (+) Transcript_6499:603-2051(+)